MGSSNSVDKYPTLLLLTATDGIDVISSDTILIIFIIGIKVQNSCAVKGVL